MEINVDRWDDRLVASSPIPLYAQLQSVIESHLDSDGYRAGDRLPSENTLISRFHVSLPTVRRALSRMVDDGLIVRKRGVGTVVVRTKPPDAALLDLDVTRGFAQAVAADGVRFVVDTDGRAGTGSGMRTERAVRNGVRIGVCRTGLPDQGAPVGSDALLQHDVLQLVTDVLGGVPAISALTVHTVKASTPDFTDLEVGPGSPVLVVETAWSDPYGVIVMWSHARWRGDQVCVRFVPAANAAHATA